MRCWVEKKIKGENKWKLFTLLSWTWWYILIFFLTCRQSTPILYMLLPLEEPLTSTPMIWLEPLWQRRWCPCSSPRWCAWGPSTTKPARRGLLSASASLWQQIYLQGKSHPTLHHYSICVYQSSRSQPEQKPAFFFFKYWGHDSKNKSVKIYIFHISFISLAVFCEFYLYEAAPISFKIFSIFLN